LLQFTIVFSMNVFHFTIKDRDTSTNARTGIIYTAHGKIRTPGFVPVGTAATVKTVTPEEFKACNLDVFFVNTYHMLFRPGIKVIQKMNGLHSFMDWNGSIMTDSGGFQAFSLGENGPRNTTYNENDLVKITEDGIFFKSAWDGSQQFLGPFDSIKAQQALGSDIMMAFDECTFYPIKKEYAQKALQRTHRWALDCLSQHKKSKNQALYGIIQGSVFEDLRVQSATFFSQLAFNGFAIGSVANSKEPREKVFQVLDWTLPYILPCEKPIHFLGIGEVEDIILSVEKGIDTLDCITPTRMGRMGWIFSKRCGVKNKFRYDITRSEFRLDKAPLEKGCNCYTCQHFTKAYINHLFRSKELLAYRLTTIHNLTFFGRLMESIRMNIHSHTFLKMKQDWLKK
jgi:queuine tRNA-ribosyltransferase